MIHNITTPLDFSIEIESLYVAHVFPNINKKRISQVFEKLYLAKVKVIDFVTKIGKDGKMYNSAYIHIETWFDTSAAKHFQEKIRTDSEALLVYDEPWYWIVNENKSAEKSKFIQKAEKDIFEGAQKQSNDCLLKTMITLDILEDAIAKDIEELNTMNEENERLQGEDEDEQRFQEHKEEYLNNM